MFNSKKKLSKNKNFWGEVNTNKKKTRKGTVVNSEKQCRERVTAEAQIKKNQQPTTAFFLFKHVRNKTTKKACWFFFSSFSCVCVYQENQRKVFQQDGRMQSLNMNRRQAALLNMNRRQAALFQWARLVQI